MRRLIQNRMPNMCTTLEGERCIFPFVYNGFTHYKCTYIDSSTPWCATAVDSINAEVITNNWGDCEVSTTSSCQTESIEVPTCTTTSGPRPGQSCVFPFRHLGIVYETCTNVGQSASWCSTSTTSLGTHIDGEYGFCPSTCPGATEACMDPQCGNTTGEPNVPAARTCISKPNGWGKCYVLCGPQCAENDGACVAKWARCKRCTSKNPSVEKSWCVSYCSHAPLECPASECHKCKDACDCV